MSNEEKRSMVERGNGRIPVYRQCELLGIPRSTCYYKKVRNPEKEEFDSRVKALISEIYFDCPFYGKRRIRNELDKYFRFYDYKRGHSAHGYKTPWEVYSENSKFWKTGATA